MDEREQRVRARAERAGQEHLLGHLERLRGSAREQLLAQIESIDFERTRELAELLRRPASAAHVPEFTPPDVFPLERGARDRVRANAASDAGAARLREGKVGYLLVAGGQASRLGYEGPKGAFPVAPVSGRTLFEWFARRLQAAHERHGAPVAWYILTSQANDGATREFFAAHDHFGLDPQGVFFFQQAMLPALDLEGRVLMKSSTEIFLAPNGHGGVLSALAESGGLAHARARGIEVFSYFQVDNPLARPADPLFLGLHALEGAQMSSKVVKKRDAAEKVGVLGRIDGKLSCIEYSDLPAALREARDAHGELVYGAGNIALHAIDLAFVEQLTRGGLRLPWHLARKQMQAVDPQGHTVMREGIKFETFVFDALQASQRSVTLEVDRRAEFSPVKNASGEDSPATARADMCRLHASWVRSARLALPKPGDDGVIPVEIDPRIAEDEPTFVERAPLAPRVLPGGHLYA